MTSEIAGQVATLEEALSVGRETANPAIMQQLTNSSAPHCSISYQVLSSTARKRT